MEMTYKGSIYDFFQNKELNLIPAFVPMWKFEHLWPPAEKAVFSDQYQLKAEPQETADLSFQVSFRWTSIIPYSVVHKLALADTNNLLK